MTVTHAKRSASVATPATEPAPASVDADAHVAAAPAVDLARTSGADPIAVADGTLLVDGIPAAGQLTKAQFFAALREQIVAAAEAELAGTDWTVDHCPWLDYWFAYYECRSARDAELALLRYAPRARDAADASGYFEPAVERVREAIRRWRITGEVDAPPIAMPAVDETIAALGPGRALDPATRSRFEGAMGTDLSQARIHDDAIGARAAASESARAFAIGSHVAFAGGEYRPGTLEGDALLAHELAHTSQQADAGSQGSSSGAMESDANQATAGIMARLLGLLAPRQAQPTLRSGLALQRCPTHQGPDEGYENKGPDQTYLLATPSLIERNGEMTAIVGQTVHFRPASEIEGVNPSARVWRAYLMNEDGSKSTHRAKLKKWNDAHGGYPVTFDRAGNWFVGMEVDTADDYFILWRQVHVFDAKKLATDLSTGLKPGSYSLFRFNLAYRGLTTYGVQKDQTANAPRDANNKPHSYITSSAKSNPMEVSSDPVTFTVVPHPDAVSFHWYQWFDNPDRHPRSYFSGGAINDLGTEKTQQITLDRRDQYTITCHQFDAKGAELPVAVYEQSVLGGDEWKQAKKWLDYVKSVDKQVADIDPTTRKQVPGVFVSKVTGESMPMAVWVGTKKDDPDKHVLVDLVFGHGPHKESGSKLSSVFSEYADWAEDNYPEGYIHLDGSQVGDKDRDIATDGETTAESIAHYLGLGSVGLTLIGFALLVFPPTDAAGWAVLGYTATGAAAAMGAASSGLSLYNRYQKGEQDALGYAIDILGLATSVLQATSAFTTAVKMAKTGKTAEELIVSTAGRKFVAWTETGMVTTTSVLITTESVLALGELSDSNMTEGEKADRIAGLLFQILVQGGMMAMQAKNLAAVQAAVNTRNLATLELQVLAQLDEQAINGLKNIPDTELSKVAMQVLDDPHGANFALRSGKVTSAETLAQEIHGGVPATTPDVPATTPDVPATSTDVPAQPSAEPAFSNENAAETTDTTGRRPKWRDRKRTMAVQDIHSQELEDELVTKGFGETDRAPLRRWGKAYARLRERATSLTPSKLIGKLKTGYGETAYKGFRLRLFDAIIDQVMAVPVDERAALLRGFLDDMPDSASIGSLFSKYRAKRFGGTGDVQAVEGIKKRLADPENLATKGRDADGAMTLKNQEMDGGPPDGTYGVDDKARGSFDLQQATDVSRLADSTNGLQMDGRTLDGYIYWCENEALAKQIARSLNENTLSSRLHVAFLDDAGTIRWER